MSRVKRLEAKKMLSIKKRVNREKKRKRNQTIKMNRTCRSQTTTTIKIVKKMLKKIKKLALKKMIQATMKKNLRVKRKKNLKNIPGLNHHHKSELFSIIPKNNDSNQFFKNYLELKVNDRAQVQHHRIHLTKYHHQHIAIQDNHVLDHGHIPHNSLT